MSSSPGDVTRLLAEIGQGNREAESRLADLVYRELHRLAERCMFGERPDHTLQPTVLVHDAFVKRVFRQIPIKASVMIPFRCLTKLPSHENQFCTRMGKHVCV